MTNNCQAHTKDKVLYTLSQCCNRNKMKMVSHKNCDKFKSWVLSEGKFIVLDEYRSLRGLEPSYCNDIINKLRIALNPAKKRGLKRGYPSESQSSSSEFSNNSTTLTTPQTTNEPALVPAMPTVNDHPHNKSVCVQPAPASQSSRLLHIMDQEGKSTGTFRHIVGHIGEKMES